MERRTFKNHHSVIMSNMHSNLIRIEGDGLNAMELWAVMNKEQPFTPSVGLTWKHVSIFHCKIKRFTIGKI